jgi:hypothetical protein
LPVVVCDPPMSRMPTQVSSGASISSLSENRGSRKQWLGWLDIGRSRRLAWARWVNMWCIWCAASRSLYGHIRIQFPIRPPTVDLGPSVLRDGILQPTTRALARHEYIQKLLAIYPWVDIVDLRIFLMGFDAGEQWADGTIGTRVGIQAATWLTSAKVD